MIAAVKRPMFRFSYAKAPRISFAYDVIGTSRNFAVANPGKILYTFFYAHKFVGLRTFAKFSICFPVIRAMSDEIRKHRVTVLLSDAESAKLERYCMDHGFKKSTLMAKLLRDRLEAEGYGVPQELPFAESTPRIFGRG